MDQNEGNVANTHTAGRKLVAIANSKLNVSWNVTAMAERVWIPELHPELAFDIVDLFPLQVCRD